MKLLGSVLLGVAVAHEAPGTCLHCEATYYQGEITGDHGCFAGDVTPEATELSCCHTSRLTIERDGEILYNILRQPDADNHDDDHHEDDDNWRTTIYKFRQCDQGQECPKYFQIFAEIDQEKCEMQPPAQDRDNKNTRVAELVEKFFDAKNDKSDKTCPYCWAGSYADSYEEYFNCLLKPDGQETTNCSEGQDTCITDYFHYADQDIVHCEIGRDCYPAAYINLEQKTEAVDCHDADCNDATWEPWITTTSCLNCEATWDNGIVSGDEGCFDGTIPGEPSDEWVQSCYTQKLKLERNGRTVYNIIRMPYSVSEPENEYYNYKFRSCAKEETCEPFYDVHDEVDRNICKNDLTQSNKRLNTNRRVGDLFEKYFEQSEEGTTAAPSAGECPYCYVGSWDHDPEAYKQCVLNPAYDGEMRDCAPDQSACITDYLYFEDRAYEKIAFCEVGRDCYPDLYDGLDQEHEDKNCFDGANCNNEPWRPWHGPPKSCVHCGASFANGTFTGDGESCFNGDFPGEEVTDPDVVSCLTDMLIVEKDGEVAYNIWRAPGYERGRDTKYVYRFKECAGDAACDEFFDVFPELEDTPETCHTRGPKEQRLADNRNARVMELAEMLERDEPVEDYGECPYCFVSTLNDEYDDYAACVTTDNYQGAFVDCKEGQDACITDYLFYTDTQRGKTTHYCEVGRDCYPPTYKDLSQTTHNMECQNGDDCNSRRWEPWRTFPDQCVHCHATYVNGEIEGDEGCFDQAIQYVETHGDNQVTSCMTERLVVEKDGQTIYNIYRSPAYSRKLEDITYTYRFRECDEAPCADYFEVFPEFEATPETCHNRDPKEQLRADKRKERVIELVEKHFPAQVDDEPELKSCPYCFVSSWDDEGLDKYENCIKSTEYEHVLAGCKEGENACITDYLHYEDAVKDTDEKIVFCEVGRDCYPPAYAGLDQTNQQIECETNNCNNGVWVPWDCDTNCAADYTTCLLGCSGDPVCQSSCLREFDQCLEKC